MGRWLKNENGITLLELIIIIAILAIIVPLGYNFFSTGVSSFGKQKDDVDNQIKARQVIRDITREIRRVNSAADIEVISGKSITIGDIAYEFDENAQTILKDGANFVTGIKAFQPKWDHPEQKKAVTIKVTTLANKGHEITLSSTIYIRE